MCALEPRAGRIRPIRARRRLDDDGRWIHRLIRRARRLEDLERDPELVARFEAIRLAVGQSGR